MPTSQKRDVGNFLSRNGAKSTSVDSKCLQQRTTQAPRPCSVDVHLALSSAHGFLASRLVRHGDYPIRVAIERNPDRWSRSPRAGQWRDACWARSFNRSCGTLKPIASFRDYWFWVGVWVSVCPIGPPLKNPQRARSSLSRVRLVMPVIAAG